ncbi:MAG: hypothetical protein WC340_15165 [Kiritimatiellia bacterium]
MTVKTNVLIIFAFIALFNGCMKCQNYTFNHEIIYIKNYDDTVRFKNVKLLETIKISSVEFDDTPVLEAIDWLAYSGQQTISYLDFNTHSDFSSTTNKTITLIMKNTTFLTVLDEICGQSERSWGFNENILMTLPDHYIRDNNDWVSKKNHECVEDHRTNHIKIINK